MTTYITTGKLSNGASYTNHTFFDAKITPLNNDSPSINDFICKRTDKPLKETSKICFKSNKNIFACKRTDPPLNDKNKIPLKTTQFTKYNMFKAHKSNAFL